MFKSNGLLSKRLSHRALLLCALASSALAPAHAQQIPVDSSVSISKSSRGVAVVNIATPNAQGMSHNVFKQFDVPRTGVILNNSAQNATSAIGGTVKGNSKLQGGPASLIVNEVTSVKTKLQGKIEVLGQKAAVVIANPNGIACDGCGFVNASRVTLATAKPQFSEGQLTSLLVYKGALSVSGSKVDVSAVDYFDLVGSNVKINTAIKGNNVLISAGNHIFQYGTSSSDGAINFDSPVLTPAIETSALGGVTGNNIRLISTGKGRGVNLSGNLAAETINIKTDGNTNLAKVAAWNIKVESSGTITTGNEIYGKLDNNTLYYAKDVSINGDKVNINSYVNSDRLNISAKSSVNFSNKAEATGGTLFYIKAPEVNLGNSWTSSNSDIYIDADSFSQESGGRLFSENVEIQSKNKISISGKVGTLKSLKLNSNNIVSSGKIYTENTNINSNDVNISGILAATNKIDVKTNNIDISGELSSGSIDILAKNINSSGGIYARDALVLKSQGTDSKFDISGKISGSDISLDSKGDVALRGNAEANNIRVNARDITLDGNQKANTGGIFLTGDSIVQKGYAEAYGESGISMKATSSIDIFGHLFAETGNIALQSTDSSFFSGVRIYGNAITRKNLSVKSAGYFDSFGRIIGESVDISSASSILFGDIAGKYYVRLSSGYLSTIRGSLIRSETRVVEINSSIFRHEGLILGSIIDISGVRSFENRGELQALTILQ